MNDDYSAVEDLLVQLRSRYASRCSVDVDDPATPITERDIVADIRYSLMAWCIAKGYHVHCEVRPAPGTSIAPDQTRQLPRIDVAVLRNSDGQSWLAAAKAIQDMYREGRFQARFSSVPVKFFHTAVEAKIQSNVASAKKDLDTLKSIQDANPSCNCFFLLLNARGRVRDHDRILTYGQEKRVAVVEFTAQRNQQ
jgi:hypothetical protein